MGLGAFNQGKFIPFLSLFTVKYGLILSQFCAVTLLFSFES